MEFVRHKTPLPAGLTACVVGFICAGCCHIPEQPIAAAQDKELRAMIASESVDGEALLNAISQLGRVNEPARYWTDIANCPTLSRPHRERAIFALFRRYAKFATSVRQLGETLAPARWLEESPITEVRELTGWIPVDVNLGETVFRISVLHGASIYIRVLGEFESADFARMLRQELVQPIIGDPVILQIGLADDYDGWFFRRPDPSSGALSRTPKPLVP